MFVFRNLSQNALITEIEQLKVCGLCVCTVVYAELIWPLLLILLILSNKVFGFAV